MKLRRNDWIGLAIALLVPQALGGIGAVATARSVDTWYRQIKKPRWNPPNWLFGPVWTALYLMMGAASWLIWRREREEKPADAPLAWPEKPETRAALTLYGAQLALNSLWSVIFFGLRSVGGGLAEIGALLAALTATVVRFYRLRPVAGLLLAPYLAWSTFAAVLNATVWRLNRD